VAKGLESTRSRPQEDQEPRDLTESFAAPLPESRQRELAGLFTPAYRTLCSPSPNPANGSWPDRSRQPTELHATPSPKSRQRKLVGWFTPTYRTPRHSFPEIPPTEVGRMVHANLQNSTPLLPRNPANGSWSDGSRQPNGSWPDRLRPPTCNSSEIPGFGSWAVAIVGWRETSADSRLRDSGLRRPKNVGWREASADSRLRDSGFRPSRL
jgi:hypothetical protein